MVKSIYSQRENACAEDDKAKAMKEFLDITAVCRKYDLTRRELNYLLDAGMFAAPTMHGKRQRWSVEDLDAWMAKGVADMRRQVEADPAILKRMAEALLDGKDRLSKKLRDEIFLADAAEMKQDHVARALRTAQRRQVQDHGQ